MSCGPLEADCCQRLPPANFCSSVEAWAIAAAVLGKNGGKRMASHGTNIGQIYKGLAVTGFSTAEMVLGQIF